MKRRRPLLFPILVALCAQWLLLAAPAVAEEEILSYHSEIRVAADASVEVTETIRVQAEGRNIRRGIYRDFPTDYRDRLGNKVQVAFELLNLRRDGRPEPHHTTRRSNGIRVYAGDKDRFLDPGIYEYELVYRVDRMLGYFENHDELYWNVTGNGWDFPIAEASAAVRLPDSVPAAEIAIEGYTGAFGSKDQDYRANVSGSGEAHISTNNSLAPKEGLTVVVTWPKGHVDEPSPMENLAFLLRQNLGLLVGVTAGLGSLFYLLMAWHRVGRDPPKGVVFPHYEPPDGFSPASIRYIAKMGYDKRALTAAVLNLAVKGYLRIDNVGDAYNLQRTDKSADETLAPGEAALLAKLFKDGNILQLENDNHATLRKAMGAHETTLSRFHRRKYFATNGRYLLPAIVFLIGALVAIVILGQFTPAIAIVMVCSAIAVAIFGWLMRAPTLLGRKLLDKVEGFGLYLQVAEKDDLNLRNPPELTPELFEAYLPYALALDVEQPWAEQFEEVFKRIRDQEGKDYQPAWYAGHWNASNPVKMATAVGSSLNSAISSAATPPGSSSGSGGGGFSGGGGGGGGGGGW